MKTTALILGGAETLWEDLAYVKKEKIEYDGVVACNQAGVEWPGPLHGWVSVHPIFFYRGRDWLRERARKGHRPARALYGHEDRNLPNDHTVRITPWQIPGEANRFGSSGLYAVKIALIDLKYDSVILCGIPMTATPHFDRKDNWKSANGFKKTWEKLTPVTASRIKSMSGWTRHKFGAPE